MTDFTLCPICGRKLKSCQDADEGRLYESEESCPHCEMYSFEFHYGFSEMRYGVIYSSWSHYEESPRDWRKHRDEAKSIFTSGDGFALFRAVRQHPEEDTPKLAMADWCDENGLALSAGHLRAVVDPV